MRQQAMKPRLSRSRAESHLGFTSLLEKENWRLRWQRLATRCSKKTIVLRGVRLRLLLSRRLRIHPTPNRHAMLLGKTGAELETVFAVSAENTFAVGSAREARHYRGLAEPEHAELPRLARC